MPQRSSGWIDVSVPLRDGMVRWPGNPPIRINRIQDMERGDDAPARAFLQHARKGK